MNHSDEFFDNNFEGAFDSLRGGRSFYSAFKKIKGTTPTIFFKRS